MVALTPEGFVNLKREKRQRVWPWEQGLSGHLNAATQHLERGKVLALDGHKNRSGCEGQQGPLESDPHQGESLFFPEP